MLGCSHSLTVINATALNLGVHIPFDLVFAFPSDKYSEVELLDHMVVLFSSF